MNWQIVPYGSVGPLSFGMSAEDVEALLGPPVTVQRNPMPETASDRLQEAYAGYVIEFRLKDPFASSMPTVHFEDGKLVAVDLFEFHRTAELQGFRLFENSKEQAVAFMTQNSKEYVKLIDGFVFTDFGISVGDDSRWEESPPINVFARGQFDDAIAESIEAGEGRLVRR